MPRTMVEEPVETKETTPRIDPIRRPFRGRKVAQSLGVFTRIGPYAAHTDELRRTLVR
jgi:hypothetical protein